MALLKLGIQTLLVRLSFVHSLRERDGGGGRGQSYICIFKVHLVQIEIPVSLCISSW